MILLDSSLLRLAYGRRGRGEAEPPPVAMLRRLIESGAALGMPAIALQEVLAGVRSQTQFEQLRAHLAAFRIVTATPQHHVEAARIAGACSVKSIACSAAEALIAAQTAMTGARLFTLNPNFAPIARLAGAKLLDPHLNQHSHESKARQRSATARSTPARSAAS